MKDIVRLEQAADPTLFGGKAANLARLLRAGLPVPDGFAISAAVYRSQGLEQLESEIMVAFDRLGAPRVAVRSSALAEDSSAASWAGLLETILNVQRDGLLAAIRHCWDSMQSARAQSYAADHQIAVSDQAVAVAVQAMIDSEIAGVMFTANPVNSDRSQLLIEAAYGLGELLVQGVITPESLIINKATGEVLSRSSAQQKKQLIYRDGKNVEVPVPEEQQNQLVLSVEQIAELIELAQQIETHYGSSQDIEWAMASGQTYIVQSRPITTLEGATITKAPL